MDFARMDIALAFLSAGVFFCPYLRLSFTDNVRAVPCCSERRPGMFSARNWTKPRFAAVWATDSACCRRRPVSFEKRC